MRKRLAGALTLAGALVAATVAAYADGTETLGPPVGVTVAAGTGVAVAGKGMFTQPKTISVTVPAGAAVKQVLLYWEGQHWAGTAGDKTIKINGVTITGTKIGGPTKFFKKSGRWVYSTAFRADITAKGWITPGTSSLVARGLFNSYRNNGAGVLVIYDDGSTAATIGLRDGNDLAFRDFAPPLDTTVAQTYTFPASPEPRTASMSMFGASVEARRPNVLKLTVGEAAPVLINDPFSNNSENEWDVAVIPVTIPAGVTSVTAQMLSDAHGTGLLPASFSWVNATFAVPPPPPPDEDPGCTLTQGYWKTHSKSGPAPYDPAWQNVGPLEENTPFLDSGQTWLEVFNTAPAGMSWYILAHQAMAAQLNVWNGADPSAVGTTLTDAMAMLDQYDGTPMAMDDIPTSAVELASILDQFNNGALQGGPPHCGTEDA